MILLRNHQLLSSSDFTIIACGHENLWNFCWLDSIDTQQLLAGITIFLLVGIFLSSGLLLVLPGVQITVAIFSIANLEAMGCFSLTSPN